MKRIAFVLCLFGLLGISGFTKRSVDHEQIVFDHFVLEILKTDFKGISSFEFKGKTESDFSTLGKARVCLSPRERLGVILEKMIKNSRSREKDIEIRHIEEVAITSLDKNTHRPKLLLYPSLRVADNYYVFLKFQVQKRQLAKYVFELTPDGRILRSCKMD